MLTKKKYNNPNIISKFVPYIEVSDYLNAADIGIIIRNNDIVNNVASPIKFSEYISCGLPVISNKSVDIITQMLENNKCGSLISLININDKVVNNLININRNKISQIGINYFGIDSVSNSYIEIYKQMNKDIV